MGGQLDGEGRAPTDLAPHRDVAAMHRRDVLDNRQAETGAAVGPAARIVHPVEALEDPLVLAGGDADAVVGDGDLDLVVLAVRAEVGPDHHPGPGVGVDHGVLHQVADRHAQLARAAQHLAARGAGDGQGDLPLLRVHPPPVHGVTDHVVDLHHLGVDQRVVTLQLRKVDDLGHQVGQPRRLHPHPAGELANRLGVVRAFLHRLGQQGDGADRGFQLVADVGHEVTADLFDPTVSGLVVRQHQDQVLSPAERP